MRRRDYMLIASVIRNMTPDEDGNVNLRELTENMAAALFENNPRFDSDLFFEAAKA